jgi:hypothetical protein
MAYYFITASKDATVYLQQPNQNAGLDEILEISKTYYSDIEDISRILIQFNLSELSSSISNGFIQLGNVNLILKETQSEEIPLEYTIYGYPISGSWEMGTGYRFDGISTSGVSWNYREGDSNIVWLSGSIDGNVDSNPSSGKGGVWFTYVSASQHFSYTTSDINMDVKNIVLQWLSGSIPNNGFILKYTSSFENDNNDYGKIKLFSKETHTIYQPKLSISWDDQQIVTGSLSALSLDGDIVVRVKNLSKEYKINSKSKIRIVGRELYPLKTFTNSYPHLDVKYLPIPSYYQIKDYETDEVIIPFSEHSKISCDESGNYIILDFTNWESNRVYKIEFKVESDDSTLYFDNDIVFKLVNK